jgi:hypothetical protein
MALMDWATHVATKIFTKSNENVSFSKPLKIILVRIALWQIRA